MLSVKSEYIATNCLIMTKRLKIDKTKNLQSSIFNLQLEGGD